MYSGQVLYGFYLDEPGIWHYDARLASYYGVLHLSRPKILLSPGDVRCLKLASHIYDLVELKHEGIIFDFVIDRSSNWPSRVCYDEFMSGEISSSLGLILVGLIYGGLHIMAWQAPFHSSIQKTLWRVSSSFLAGSGFFMVGLLWLFNYCEEDFYLKSASKVLLSIFGILFFPTSSHYVFSRVYLLVDSFLQLALLPDAVYQIPNWSQYFPHII